MPCVNHPEVLESLVQCSRCGKPFCRDCVVTLKGLSYCAGCKTEQVKDIQSGADTTQLDLATIGKRFAAIFLDGLVIVPVVFGIAFGLSFALAGAGAMGAGEETGLVILLGITVAASIPPLLYEGLMLQFYGQTLGKMALKIKVVTPEGNAISPGQAWGRAFTRVVFNNLRLLALINYVSAMVGKERKCIHDSIAGTRVINWRP